jgi:hypothetical protein
MKTIGKCYNLAMRAVLCELDNEYCHFFVLFFVLFSNMSVSFSLEPLHSRAQKNTPNIIF